MLLRSLIGRATGPGNSRDPGCRLWPQATQQACSDEAETTRFDAPGRREWRHLHDGAGPLAEEEEPSRAVGPTCKSAEPLNWQDQRCDFGDQDAKFYEDMARGVPLGVVGEMPRTPAVRQRGTWHSLRTVANDSSVQTRLDVILKQMSSRRTRQAMYADKLLLVAQRQYRSRSRRTLSGSRTTVCALGISSASQGWDIHAVMHHFAAKQVPHFMLLFDAQGPPTGTGP